jgi:hypothetical protein
MSSTATKIAVQSLFYFGVSRVLVCVEQSFRSHNHPVDAITALRGLLLDEGFLQIVRTSAASQPLERRDIPILHRTDGNAARSDRPSLHNHRACAAL